MPQKHRVLFGHQPRSIMHFATATSSSAECADLLVRRTNFRLCTLHPAMPDPSLCFRKLLENSDRTVVRGLQMKQCRIKQVQDSGLTNQYTAVWLNNERHTAVWLNNERPCQVVMSLSV